MVNDHRVARKLDSFLASLWDMSEIISFLCGQRRNRYRLSSLDAYTKIKVFLRLFFLCFVLFPVLMTGSIQLHLMLQLRSVSRMKMTIFRLLIQPTTKSVYQSIILEVLLKFVVKLDSVCCWAKVDELSS